MYINRLQAIDIAISAIKILPETEENKQAIIRLTNMKQDRYINWTKELVFQYLDNWTKEHERNPTVTNLVELNMPKATTIQKLFDMKASAFLNIYYPPKEKRINTSKYTIKSQQEWIDDFIEQFNQIQPKTSKDYNVKRDKSTPTWLTIARYLNATTWNELLKLTSVNTKCLHIQCQPITKEYVVNSSSSLYEKLENLINKE